MVIIFDLDDTLYPEAQFVNSGLNAVALFGEEIFGWPAKESLLFMTHTLKNEGRDFIFNKWLSHHNSLTKTLLKKCVSVYRTHVPNISLDSDIKNLIRKYSEQYPIYLVTDGNKVVQYNKVCSLDILPFFKGLYITHRFGIKNAKPSLHCFDLIRKREDSDWRSLIYIGDNPLKDFVNLNLMGSLTIRVLTGMHKDMNAPSNYEGKIKISSLLDLTSVIPLRDN